MNEPPVRKLDHCAKYLASALHGLWCAPPLQLRPVDATLELPLRPSRRLRAARWLLLLLILLYSLELLLTGHRMVMLLALLASGGLWPLPRRFCAHRKKPDCLLLPGEGLQLRYPDGELHPPTCSPKACASDPHLLLVLRTEGHALRLLLGPDNLEPRNSRPCCAGYQPDRPVAGTALHSAAAAGSKPDPT